ncbi:MAG: LexA family protein [Candidatus Micrarchaeaceae archaeon]
MEQKQIRPTKKQRELLVFISAFIAEHGYSPSYREIMNGLQYTSVATVALHVKSLIVRGHLRKRDYSARSLEVVNPADAASVTTNHISPGEEKWLVDRVEHLVRQAEQESAVPTARQLHDLAVLYESLGVLGLEAAAASFQPRLAVLRKRGTAPGG